MLLHDVTRCFRRVFKKPYKIVFLNTLLLDAKKRKNKKKRVKIYTPFWGVLKTGRT